MKKLIYSTIILSLVFGQKTLFANDFRPTLKPSEVKKIYQHLKEEVGSDYLHEVLTPEETNTIAWYTKQQDAHLAADPTVAAPLLAAAAAGVAVAVVDHVWDKYVGNGKSQHIYTPITWDLVKDDNNLVEQLQQKVNGTDYAQKLNQYVGDNPEGFPYNANIPANHFDIGTYLKPKNPNYKNVKQVIQVASDLESNREQQVVQVGDGGNKNPYIKYIPKNHFDVNKPSTYVTKVIMAQTSLTGYTGFKNTLKEETVPRLDTEIDYKQPKYNAEQTRQFAAQSYIPDNKYTKTVANPYKELDKKYVAHLKPVSNEVIDFYLKSFPEANDQEYNQIHANAAAAAVVVGAVAYKAAEYALNRFFGDKTNKNLSPTPYSFDLSNK